MGRESAWPAWVTLPTDQALSVHFGGRFRHLLVKANDSAERALAWQRVTDWFEVVLTCS